MLRGASTILYVTKQETRFSLDLCDACLGQSELTLGVPQLTYFFLNLILNLTAFV